MIVTVYFLKNQFELSDTSLDAGYKFRVIAQTMLVGRRLVGGWSEVDRAPVERRSGSPWPYS